MTALSETELYCLFISFLTKKWSGCIVTLINSMSYTSLEYFFMCENKSNFGFLWNIEHEYLTIGYFYIVCTAKTEHVFNALCPGQHRSF